MNFPTEATELDLGTLACDMDFADIAARLRKLSNLRTLSVQLHYDCKGGGLQILSGLQHLRELRLSYPLQIHDLSPLMRLTELQVLKVLSIRKADVSPISHLTRLEELLLDGETKNLKQLETLVRLRRLTITSNKNVRLATFAGAKQLEALTLSGSKIVDFETLSSFPSLRSLVLSNTNIERLEQIPDLTNLEHLGIAHCRRLSSLDGIEKFKRLEGLVLHENKRIASIFPLSSLPKLATVFMRDTQIADGDLAPFTKMRSLTELTITNYYGEKAVLMAKKMPWCHVSIQGLRQPVAEVSAGIAIYRDVEAGKPVYRIDEDLSADLGFETNDEAEDAIVKELKRQSKEVVDQVEFDSESARFVARSKSLEALRTVASTARRLAERRGQDKNR
jgi:hypothetical protein